MFNPTFRVVNGGGLSNSPRDSQIIHFSSHLIKARSIQPINQIADENAVQRGLQSSHVSLKPRDSLMANCDGLMLSSFTLISDFRSAVLQIQLQ